MGVEYLSSEQDTGTTLHVHHMIFTSFLSQLFLTLLSLVTSPPIASTTSSRAHSAVLENARRDRVADSVVSKLRIIQDAKFATKLYLRQ